MPKIDANGISQHYLTVGRGSDVVMLHGCLGNLAVWHLYIVPALRGEFRLTTVDLRGHGYSEITPVGYTTQNLAKDLKGLLDVLDIRRPHLVGHSFGADVCLHFALLYPDRVDRIVAIEPGLAALVHHLRDKEWEGWRYWVTKLEEVGLIVPPDRRTDLEYLLMLSLHTPKFYGPARGLPRNRQPLINLLRNTTLMRDCEDPGSLGLDAIGRIEAPVYLAYGERSQFLKSYDFLRHALPRCRTALLPGGEHFGPLEQPERLVTLIREHFGSARPPELNAPGFVGRAAGLSAVIRGPQGN